ncbi:MAG: co-chaperone GroES [Chlamydiota bacterium]
MVAPKIKPLGKRVLIKRVKAQQSRGGILLPESAQEKPKQGDVIAVGPGVFSKDGEFERVELAIGDKVLFSAYAGSEVKTADQENEYLIMSQDDVLAIIK